MNLNSELQTKLIQFPSYLKKGNSWLASKFGLTEAEVKSIKNNLKNKTTIDPSLKEVSRKMWQNAKGDWLQSVQFKAGETIDTQTIEMFESNLLEKIGQKSPVISAFHGEKHSDLCYVVSIADFHFDQLDSTSMIQKRELFMDKLYKIMDRVKNYDLEQIVFVIGNDFLNSENLTQKTVKGTTQYNSVSWSEAFTQGVNLLVDAINFLSTISTVAVISVQGNHSKTTEFYMANVLKAWFRNNANVYVDSDNLPTKYFTYGRTLLGFNHGEIKPAELPLIMATDVPEAWGQSTYREFLCGHIHKEKVNEYRGVKVRFLPSLVEDNEWHKESGYGHMQATQGILYHSEQGFYGLFELNLK